ncbi:MAG: transposase family protein [Deltaproteobacteria bacterium]|nr:transposase family protein [Deltaproteobacteria bacterium]
MKELYTVAEISEAMGITPQAVKVRAFAEKWLFRTEKGRGRGGIKKLYLYISLPEDVRQAITAWEVRRDTATGWQMVQEGAMAARVKEAPKIMRLTPKEMKVALARTAVLRAGANFCLSRAGGKTAALKEFYGRLNAVLRWQWSGARKKQRSEPSAAVYQELADLGFEPHEIPEVLANIKKVSWQTSYKWAAKQENSPGLCALGRGYGLQADGTYQKPGLGVQTMTPDMKAYITALFWKGQVKLWPKSSTGRDACATRLECNKALIYRRLKAEFAQHTHLPHYGHFTKFLESFLYKEQEKLAAICLPSFWRAQFQPKGGLSGEQAGYFGERWEIDATPADVMLADGRHEILAAVDIFSRDAIIEVEKHATSLTVAKLFRQGFLAWGVPEWIIGDRGMIFKSQHIRTACAQMGIAQRDCDAYAPWQKPHVETFFGSMARMLFEALPWYVGHNPVQRKRIDEFQRFQEVFYHQKNPVKLSCGATAAELKAVVTDWLEKVYRAETHRFKDCRLGRSGLVWERQANSPKRAPRIASPEHLDTLMAPAFERTYNSGFSWGGMLGAYMADSAAGMERVQNFQGKRVIFKPSLADVTRGTIWECLENGQPGPFICTVHNGLRGGLDLEEHIKAKARIVRAHKGNRKLAEGLCGPMDYGRQLAVMPKPKVAVAGFGAADYQGGAYRELQDYDDRAALRLVPDAARDRKIEDGAAELANIARQRQQVLEDLKESPEVQEYVAIIKALARGGKLNPEQRQARHWFEKSDSYRRLEAWFEAVKLQAATEVWE